MARDLDWTRTGTLQAMGEWVRAEIGAVALMAVRATDAVLLAELWRPLLDVEQAMRRNVEQLADAIARERRNGRRTNHAGTLHARVEWLRTQADAICVLAVRQRDAVLLLDERCRPEDAARLVMEYLPDLVQRFGETAKYKGARLVFEPCPM